jgi:hypothetical protein
MTKLLHPVMFGFMRYLLLALLIAIFSMFSLEARVDRRPACFKELERNFFDRVITTNAFSLYEIKQGGWTAMVNELQRISQTEVPKMTWKEGQRMRKNPLDTVYRQSEAGVILGKVLFDVFNSVCKQYNVTSNAIIRDMFRYIEQQQASKIRRCFDRDTFAPTDDEKENE